jgi:putative SOS response-associated peptidase YedK
MCYYNGVKVSKEESARLRELEKRYYFLNDDLVIYKGFDYNNIDVIIPKAGAHETERVKMEWGFLPKAMTTDEIMLWRQGYNSDKTKKRKPILSFNARSEELLEKIFNDAALNRRCLIPSNGFYEWRHVKVKGKKGDWLKTPETYPYHIEMINEPEFYFAGVWQPSYNRDTKVTTNTVAIVTTTAVGNRIMEQVHNSRLRMPTILPGHLAEAWLYKNLSNQEILDIANYQVASNELTATPLHKRFYENERPNESIHYAEVTELESA